MKKFGLVAIIIIGLVVAGAALTGWWGGGRAEPPSDRAAALAKLPEPIRRYLEAALGPNVEPASVVKLKLEGRIKPSEDSSWSDYEATQTVTLNPPQLAWSARIDYLPLLPVHTVTKLAGGRGRTESKLAGLMSMLVLANDDVGRYLLLRWLAEAVWYPEVLLACPGLTWQEMEAPVAGTRQIRATLKRDGRQVEGEFTFIGRSRAPSFFTSRNTGAYRWYCNYSGWRRESGRQIPTLLTQGLQLAAARDDRLKLELAEIEYR